MNVDFSLWRLDPCVFINGALLDPETSQPFELYSAEAEFICRAFILAPDGRLPFPEMFYSAPKKAGKTGLAAMLAIYTAVAIGGRFAEVYCLSNDYEQSVGRVFEAARRMVEASPLLSRGAKITTDRITFVSTGSFIQACASDYAGFAGANPSLCIFDELWGYVSERSQRLWDEAVPSPTRKVSGRLTVSYAGFSGESTLLEDLWKRGLAGVEVAPDLHASAGMLAYITHRPPAPWQTTQWLGQMREQLRSNAYLRLIENRWVTSESSFVEMDWWDACTDADAHPLLTEPNLPVWVGVDASVKRDSTAIVCATFDRAIAPGGPNGAAPAPARVRLVWHKVFQPSPYDPLHFEAIERTLLELIRRFHVKEIRFDPYQLVAVAQRLTIAGLPMIKFPQSVPNITEASSNLYELVKGHNLRVYPDDEMRLAVSRAVAVEIPSRGGWKIAKEKASHKIDIVIALAQAALGAVREGQGYQAFEYRPAPKEWPKPAARTGEEIAGPRAARSGALASLRVRGCASRAVAPGRARVLMRSYLLVRSWFSAPHSTGP